MNDETDKINSYANPNNVPSVEGRLLSLDPSMSGSFLETVTNSQDLIAKESSSDISNATNYYEPEVPFSQNQGGLTIADSVLPAVDESALPSTAIVLNTNWGSKVYVVGTSHFSIESQEDVAKVIAAVQPNCIVVELCSSRSYMLYWTEEKFEVAKNMDYKMIKEVVDKYGVFQGIVQLLLLSMSFEIVREMGMAPGGEFRRAFRESLNIPGCVIFLGDRPIEITLRRAFASMSWWQLIKFAYCILFSKVEINKEEVEKCKNRDYLENMLEMFGGEFPSLKEVFVNERDLYLTYSLVNAAMITPKDTHPKVVVGVVGMGHLAGIQQHWETGKVDVNDILKVSRVPPQSRASKINFDEPVAKANSSYTDWGLTSTVNFPLNKKCLVSPSRYCIPKIFCSSNCLNRQFQECDTVCQCSVIYFN